MVADTVSLKGQTAIVTGSSSGIGQACAIELARAGASVVVNYHSDEAGASDTLRQIKEFDGEGIAIKADVSSEADVQNMFSATLDKYKTLDILVNNAGIQKDAPFVDMTVHDWNLVLSVNLTSMFLCSQAAVRQFLKQGVRDHISAAAGKIICMSSVHQVIPWAGHINYATSKGGIMMFVKSLAQEMAPAKIRVNSIAPGAIETHINVAAWKTEEAREDLLKLIPYGRVGVPADIGKACAWLASDLSDYVQGATIFVDGGMTLYPGFAHGG